MPEPVVIIGLAKGPAGPIAEPAEAADRAVVDDAGLPPEHKSKKGTRKKSMILPALARLGSGLFMLLARGLLIVASMGMSLARRYPRHSLAAGASFLILGAIWYMEMLPGKGERPPVSNQIKAASSTDSPTAPKNPANAKTEGAAAIADTIASTNPGTSSVTNPDDKVTAPPAASALEDKSAQAATHLATDDTAAPLPLPLSGAPTAGQDSERALEKTAPAADLAAAKPEPAPIPASPVDQSTPSLLGSEPPDAAPSPSSAVVKNDKTDGDAVKPAPAMEAPALIAALTPSSSPPAEVAPAPAPTGDPVQLATTGDDQIKTSPASAPKPPLQSPASGSPQPATTTGAIADADIKPNETHAPNEPKMVVKPQDAPKKDPGMARANPAVSQSESTPSESVKSEPPKPEIAKVEPPAPVWLRDLPRIPKCLPVPPATPGVHVPDSDVTRE